MCSPRSYFDSLPPRRIYDSTSCPSRPRTRFGVNIKGYNRGEMGSKVEMLTAVGPEVRPIAEYARKVEQAGWDGISVYDSQNLTADSYVGMTIAAMATERIEISLDVTNPLTRHPAVTAGAIASVQQVSGGRAVLGIGRGDSALAYVGHAPVYTSFFERYLEALQAYLKGEGVPFDDLTFGKGMAPHVDTLRLEEAPEDSRMIWLDPEDKKVPVAVAASGPKVIGAAARHADIVMLALGAEPDRFKWGMEQARDAREEAGLDPDGIRYGAYLVVVCHPDVEVGRKLYPHLDTTARFSVMHGKTYGPVTKQDQEVLKGLHKGFKMFNMSEHSSSIARPAGFVDRFAIVGPPEECIRRIREVIELGIDRIVVNGPTVDAVEDEAKVAADLMVKEVLPAFSG